MSDAIDNMIKTCREQAATGMDRIVLTVPREPTGKRVRLIAEDRRSPLGDVLSVTRGRTSARFKASQVAAYLERVTEEAK